MTIYSKLGSIISGLYLVVQVIVFVIINNTTACYIDSGFSCTLLDWLFIPAIFMMWLLTEQLGIDFTAIENMDTLIYLPYFISVLLVALVLYSVGFLVERLIKKVSINKSQLK